MRSLVADLLAVAGIGPVTVLVWSRTGAFLAVARGRLDDTIHSVQIVRLDGRVVSELHPNGAVLGMAWSPVDDTLAVASMDGNGRLWTPDGGWASLPRQVVPNAELAWGVSNPLMDVAWSPSADRLAFASIDFHASRAGGLSLPGSVEIWQGGALERSVPAGPTGGKFLHVGWTAHGLLVAGAISYSIWDSGTDASVTLRAGGPPAFGFAISADGNSIAIGDENGRIVMMSTRGTETGASNAEGSVSKLAFSDDGTTIFALAGAGLSSRTIAGSGTDAVSLGQARDFARVGNGLLVVLDTGLVVNMLEGKSVATLDGCESPTAPITADPDGALVASATAGPAVCVWKLR